ncbi:hypothetical protein CYMTET_18255 [Cymbomonas tetramitiformis]|uniref:Uncharacterized protein n=1 Tax=Cymbomonas tetramitiformis TaxID=36881 RepID=A0AAE0L639_9CHLO|nr:hypothetical protein CYMTET_18255 [Cymbomonas tetramitiformis]
MEVDADNPHSLPSTATLGTTPLGPSFDGIGRNGRRESHALAMREGGQQAGIAKERRMREFNPTPASGAYFAGGQGFDTPSNFATPESSNTPDSFTTPDSAAQTIQGPDALALKALHDPSPPHHSRFKSEGGDVAELVGTSATIKLQDGELSSTAQERLHLNQTARSVAEEMPVHNSVTPVTSTGGMEKHHHNSPARDRDGMDSLMQSCMNEANRIAGLGQSDLALPSVTTRSTQSTARTEAHHVAPSRLQVQTSGLHANRVADPGELASPVYEPDFEGTGEEEEAYYDDDFEEAPEEEVEEKVHEMIKSMHLQLTRGPGGAECSRLMTPEGRTEGVEEQRGVRRGMLEEMKLRAISMLGNQLFENVHGYLLEARCGTQVVHEPQVKLALMRMAGHEKYNHCFLVDQIVFLEAFD